MTLYHHCCDSSVTGVVDSRGNRHCALRRADVGVNVGCPASSCRMNKDFPFGTRTDFLSPLTRSGLARNPGIFGSVLNTSRCTNHSFSTRFFPSPGDSIHPINPTGVPALTVHSSVSPVSCTASKLPFSFVLCIHPGISSCISPSGSISSGSNVTQYCSFPGIFPFSKRTSPKDVRLAFPFLVT